MKRSDIPEIEVLGAVYLCNNQGERTRIQRYMTVQDMLPKKYPPKVVLAKMYKLEKMGLLRMGDGFHAWLTDKGEKLLSEAAAHFVTGG